MTRQIYSLHALLCLLISSASDAAFSPAPRVARIIAADPMTTTCSGSDVRIIPSTICRNKHTCLYNTFFPFGGENKGDDKDSNEDDEDDEIEEEFDVEAFLAEKKRAKEAGGSGDAAAAPSEEDEEEESKNLTSKFFENLRMRNIGRNTKFGRRNPIVLPPDDDEDEDEDEDYEDPDDEQVRNITASEMNIFLGRDDGAVGKLAGNVTFTNKEMYASLKERILESPQTFRRLTVGADDDEDEAAGFEDADAEKPYVPPENVPDSELTAGEVVTTVLAALQHNDVPTKNRGVEILFGYSSPASILADPIRAPAVDEYAEILASSDSKILYEHNEVIFDKADYSQDKERVFITVRLREGPGDAWTSVNFILSNRASDDCWLIDSHLIRPKGLRRGRRW